jgi:hypothetical protein
MPFKHLHYPQTLRGEHMSRCIGRLAGKVRRNAGKRQAGGTDHDADIMPVTLCLNAGSLRLLDGISATRRMARQSSPSRMPRRPGWCWQTPRFTSSAPTRSVLHCSCPASWPCNHIQVHVTLFLLCTVSLRVFVLLTYL